MVSQRLRRNISLSHGGMSLSAEKKEGVQAGDVGKTWKIDIVGD